MGIREGCSPGFWSRKQHIKKWQTTGYAPENFFNTVFGRNALWPTITLFNALNPNPPMTMLNQLARQAVAALLNAAHPDINYPLSVNQVITKFQAAFDSGNLEETKDEFECYNQFYCPLS